MRSMLIVGLVLLIFFPSFFISAQSNNRFTENTPDSTKFNAYLDSIGYYLYANANISNQYINKCDSFIKNEIVISNFTRRKFIELLINSETNKKNYIKAYQIFNENKDFLLAEDVSEIDKQWNKYSKGYILFSLGDLESAQKIYNDMVLWAKKNNNNQAQRSGLYSLAQLQSSQKNYKTAEKNFLKVHEMEMTDSSYSFNHLITIYELSKLNYETDKLNNATYYDSLGFSIAKELSNPIFTFEFINNMALVALKKKQFAKAEILLVEAKIIIDQLQSNRHTNTYLLALAESHKIQKRFPESLKVYEKLIATDSKEDPNHTINLYEKIHEIYHKTGNNNKAYHYLLSTKNLQDSIFNEKKLRQVNFLNTKFEVEQKEKENQLLTSQVLQKHTQNKFLYAIISLFALGLLGLFTLFFQKQKYYHRLKHEVKSQTKELQRTNQRLMQSNMELEQFNYILSHDIKEPLRSIVGFSTLAKKRIESNKDVREYLRFIENSGKQLHTLIEDVSTFHEIDKISIQKTREIDLNELMGSILNSIISLIEKKSIKIEYLKLPSIQTNHTILFLVLKNIIENGVKYNNKEIPEIEVKYLNENNQHIFRIKDNGIGIDPEFHIKIFGMFKRLNDRGKYQGTGLGLSLAQKTIKKIGGKISIIYSEIGKGSVFEVSFPEVSELNTPQPKVAQFVEDTIA